MSLEEKSKIEAHFDCSLSIHQISQKIGRHRKTISSFLHNKENYGKNYKGRTNRATTATDRLSILREASNSQDSAAKIKEKTGVQGSLAMVRRVINSAEHIQTRNLKKKRHLMT